MEVGGGFRPLFWYDFPLYHSKYGYNDTKSLYVTSFAIKLDFKGKQTFLLLIHLFCKKCIFFIYQNGHGISMKFTFQYKIYPSQFFLYVFT